MITVEEAARIFSLHLPPMGKKSAVSIRADRDYPPFDRVMMDGIAVSFKAFEEGRRSFKVEGVSPAGEAAKTLSREDSCFEVMTGAPLPMGASLVIPYEHLKLENGTAQVVVEVPRVFKENVHLEGSDCRKGDVVLEEASELNGPHQGIATSMGLFLEKKSLRILIISTGDELVEVDQAPLPHQIRRSNVYALRESLLVNGFQDVGIDHLKDDPMTVARHYEKHAAHFDLMIYSGGVSKGKYDYLPNVWADMGVTRHFHEVSQRPGKPLWFGTDEKRGTRVIGLPGNPVSGLVCLHRYIIPGRKVYVELKEEIVFKKDLTYFVPVRIHFREDGKIEANPLKIKNSGEFTALATSDGFIELPREKSVFQAGECFSFYPWRNF